MNGRTKGIDEWMALEDGNGWMTGARKFIPVGGEDRHLIRKQMKKSQIYSITDGRADD